MLGVALGLYVPISKRLLGCILAFASGGLISALAIELAFNGAIQLHHQGFGVGASWSLVGSGFAIGAMIYSAFTRYLEQRAPPSATQRAFANSFRAVASVTPES